MRPKRRMLRSAIAWMSARRSLSGDLPKRCAKRFCSLRYSVTGVTPIRQPVPVGDYLRPQTRFAHLFAGEGRPDVVAALQDRADRNIARYGLLTEETS